jgi:hypothetical protein
MKRLTLLLLLATTATCSGQSSEWILNSIGSSDMSTDLVVTGPSYIDELDQMDRQSNEATQRQFDTIRREEQIEALREHPQQDNAFYSPSQTKYDRTKHSKQHERSSATGKGQDLTSRYSTSSDTTPPVPRHDSSKNGCQHPPIAKIKRCDAAFFFGGFIPLARRLPCGGNTATAPVATAPIPDVRLCWLSGHRAWITSL